MDLTKPNDTLRCLFYSGPTWDGDIPSKVERDDLFAMGLASRVDGWNFLTREGMEACIAFHLDREKEKRDRDRRKRDLNMMRALGCYVQADAYLNSFPDSEADAAYLRRGATWWRLMSRTAISEDAALRRHCADAAKNMPSVKEAVDAARSPEGGT